MDYEPVSQWFHGGKKRVVAPLSACRLRIREGRAATKNFWMTRSDHDPIWLGVQPTEPVDDLWPELVLR
jgi:hypothetical protein